QACVLMLLEQVTASLPSQFVEIALRSEESAAQARRPGLGSIPCLTPGSLEDELALNRSVSTWESRNPPALPPRNPQPASPGVRYSEPLGSTPLAPAIAVSWSSSAPRAI